MSFLLIRTMALAAISIAALVKADGTRMHDCGYNIYENVGMNGCKFGFSCKFEANDPAAPDLGFCTSNVDCCTNSFIASKDTCKQAYDRGELACCFWNGGGVIVGKTPVDKSHPFSASDEPRYPCCNTNSQLDIHGKGRSCTGAKKVEPKSLVLMQPIHM